MKKILLVTGLLAGVLGINAFATALPKTHNFATEATYPPFEYVDAKGNMQGFDIDVANALCKKMQVTCTFSNQPWDSLIPSLKLGKFDALIGAMNITPERQQQVDFTTPYYASTGSYITLRAKPIEISPEGLKDKIVGVQGGTTFEQYMQGVYPKVKIMTYKSIQDAFLDLKSGRVNVVFGDSPILMNWLKENDQSAHQYTIIGRPVIDQKYFGTGYGIAVKKGNAELLDALNHALTIIRNDGTFDALVQKYFYAQ